MTVAAAAAAALAEIGLRLMTELRQGTDHVTAIRKLGQPEIRGEGTGEKGREKRGTGIYWQLGALSGDHRDLSNLQSIVIIHIHIYVLAHAYIDTQKYIDLNCRSRDRAKRPRS
jgi:hypothetical protein